MQVQSLVVLLILLSFVGGQQQATAQNSMVGDGFGGRLWYTPSNYTVGSYSAFSLCYGSPCDGATNQLYGWGHDSNGELGNGPLDDCSDVPVPIPNMTDVRYYTTGYWMSAIKNDNTGWVWQSISFPTPTQVITDVKFVDAGAQHVGFVKNDGTVWNIGNNTGTFGDGTATSNFTTPVQMTGVNNAVRIACGMFTNYVLLADGTVLSVGLNRDGLLGDPSITDSMTTTAAVVPGLTDIVDIKAHTWATVALSASGDVYYWGSSFLVGNGTGLTDSVPSRIPGLNNIVAISGCTDGLHFMFLDANRNCYMWGEPPWVTADYQAPDVLMQAPLLVGTDVIDIMAGETFSYFVKSDGSLWMAGGAVFCSVSLDLPAFEPNGDIISRTVFTRMDPSTLLSNCPLVTTAAIASVACDGSGGVITVTRTGGPEPYVYDIGGGQQASNVFTGVASGDYTVTVTDADGCQTTATCTLDLSDPPPVIEYLGLVDLNCPDGCTLPWGEVVHSSGTYSNLVSSATGCDTLRMISVQGPLPHVYQNVDICEGSSYTLPSGRVINAAGFYSDTVAVANSCNTVHDVYVNYGEAPEYFFIVPDTVILPGESVELVIIPGAASYAWSPAVGLSCVVCPFPIASPTTTTEYCVVLSPNGCPSDTACIKIQVDVQCTAEDIFVPTAFSPNASGKNDTQCVYGAECIKRMSFRIFDRIGTKVFETYDPKACWDGLHNGQPLNAGVFVYVLSVTLTTDEVVEREGNITLVR